MRLRQRVVKGRLQLNDPLGIDQLSGSNNAIGDQCFQPAKTRPAIEQARITEALDRYQLVIALQKNTLVFFAVGDQSIDCFSRGRPPIDIIAQKNENRSGDGPARHVGVDTGQKLIEQVEAAVNIADRINPQICRYRRAAAEYLKLLNSGKRRWHVQLAVAGRNSTKGLRSSPTEHKD